MEQLTAEQGQEQPDREETLLAAIGYLPMMFFVPLLVGRPRGFARFHGKQSLVLFGAFAAVWIAIWVVEVFFGRMMGNLIILGFVFKAIAWLVYNVVGAVVAVLYLALMVVAIVRSTQGREWRIPFIDAYSRRLQFWS